MTKTQRDEAIERLREVEDILANVQRHLQDGYSATAQGAMDQVTLPLAHAMIALDACTPHVR